jgi:hypothetical protein
MELPDRVTFTANPDIAAKYVLEKFGVITYTYGGTRRISLPMKLKRRRRWWLFGYRWWVQFHNIAEFSKVTNSNGTGYMLNLRVFGHDNVQDACELAGLLAQVYNDQVDVVLQTEEAAVEEKIITDKESLEKVQSWFNSME